MKQIVGIVIILFLVPLTTSAQDFCEGNFDYDDDCDGSDAFIFKTDFGRSVMGNPCPPDGPAPVPKTGQTTSYNLGDDGDYEKGVEWPNPRFTDNGNGTVTDYLTGLIWLRDANCSLFDAPRIWEDAINLIVPQLEDGYCGLTDGSNPGDWRLPNRRELFTLINDEYYNPALSDTSGNGQWSPADPFNNVQSYNYWSSTTFASDTRLAWYVNMINGGVDHFNKDHNNFYVWPVRGGR